MVAATANAHEMWGGQTYAHIPAMPYWIFVLRAVESVLAFLMLVLGCIGAATIGGWGGYGMTIFTSIFTFGFLGYISTARFAPNAYNAWAHLGLEIACTIFWLSSFGLMATLATAFAYWDVYGLNGSGSAGIGATKAGAAFGAFEWVAFVATLVGFSIQLHAWRKSGVPSTMGGEHKMNSVGANQGYQQPPMPQQYQPAQQFPEQHYQA